MGEERIYVVEGMTCAHCERSAAEEVSEVPGVLDVQADHATGRVVVRGSEVDEAAVRAAVAEAGYSVA
jgi:copper chaperone